MHNTCSLQTQAQSQMQKIKDDHNGGPVRRSSLWYILTRLPIISAVHFKCVSKSWLSLFSNSQFAKEPLARITTKNHNDYERWNRHSFSQQRNICTPFLLFRFSFIVLKPITLLVGYILHFIVTPAYRIMKKGCFLK